MGSVGLLEAALEQKFRPAPLVPIVVNVTASDLGQAQPTREQSEALPDARARFQQHVGELVVVQDASATKNPGMDAAASLVDTLEQLVSAPTGPQLFLCCANRGLLSRALSVALRRWPGSTGRPVTLLLRSLLRATALGQATLREDRPPCWPMEAIEGTQIPPVACWPMDMESLLLPAAGSQGPGIDGLLSSPIGQVVQHATRDEEWDTDGRCGNCDSRDGCPFRQNAKWLQAQPARLAFLRLLRRGELATGQRWNFRDSFSLVAEVMIGEWSDFAGFGHPCDFVHLHMDRMSPSNSPTTRLDSSFGLMSHLYPHAMFSGRTSPGLPEAVAEYAREKNLEHTLAVSGSTAARAAVPGTYIREFLRETFSPRVDPVLLSPHSDTHPLGCIEDSYSQSVGLGNDRCWSLSPAEAERVFFDSARTAEEVEWDELGRESAHAAAALRFLRAYCSALAKRSLGARLGHHANEGILEAYEATLRDPRRLNHLTDALRSLLGGREFRFNIVESLGQPTSDARRLVTLRASTLRFEPFYPAPDPEDRRPAHDFPFLMVAGHAIPLTFDLYMALRLREAGCISSTLPGSVRAAIDRIRHVQAGELCREREQFVVGSSEFEIDGHGRIVVQRRSEPPVFVEEA